LATSSTGLYALLEDASSKHFIPPERKQDAWENPPMLTAPAKAPGAQGGAEENDDEDNMVEFKWDTSDIGTPMLQALDKPEDFDPRRSYAEGAPLTNGGIKEARNILCNVSRTLVTVWYPAPRYDSHETNLLSAAVKPSRDCKATDARLCTLDFPELAEVMGNKPMFYTALAAMATPGYVTIASRDQGWIVTTNTDKMPSVKVKPWTGTAGAGRGGGMKGTAAKGPGTPQGLSGSGRGYRGGFGGRGQQSFETTGFAPRAVIPAGAEDVEMRANNHF
jgi:hypothetical protein